MEDTNKFGTLKLSVEGTNNGRGFDILYNFGNNHDHVEFTSKEEFKFIQPWMQFPAKEYSDECKLVSIELVRRFNAFPELEKRFTKMEESLEYYIKKFRELEDKQFHEEIAKSKD